MGFQAKTIPLVIVLVCLSFTNVCLGARKLNSLYQEPPMALTYHKGTLLEGNLPVSILWYGEFSPAQKSIIADSLLSLNSKKEHVVKPLVSHWWNTIQTYLKKADKSDVRIVLANQVTDRNCSIGKLLKKPQISLLAKRVHSKHNGLTLVLTAQDVAVEGFCMSNCGYHSSNAKEKSVFIWVGNSVTQCPGQCAWPFHQPIYGPQTPALGAPNGDVGVDGMIINIASVFSDNVVRFKSSMVNASLASDASVVARLQSILSGDLGAVILSVLLLHSAGYFVGYTSAAICGFRESERRAISIEVGMQNSSLGVVLATSHFTSPMVALPPAMSAVIMNIMGSSLGFFWRHVGGSKQERDDQERG